VSWQPAWPGTHLTFMSKSKSRSLIALAAFGAATAGAAWYGARHRRNAGRDSWYQDLDKPGFAPAGEAFPVVWTALYAMIAWSGWRVWCTAPSRERNRALGLWIAQLVANARWSKLFFEQRRPLAALGDAVALERIVLSYISAARKVDRAAAGVFVPYAAWVAFTGVLNAEIARRNLAD
jgi:translocator protein